MDVKSAFLYGKINEEVYVSQPSGFIDPMYPKKVYKVVKALYGLHQAPRAWYATLCTFLLKNGYRRGTIDKTLFIKKDKNDIIVKTDGTPIETQKPLVKDEEASDVDVHLYRSMIDSLMYLTASRPDIMFARSSFDLEAYSDSDYAGANLDRKSTTGGCQFLGRRLISWQCKKQTIVATSTTEAQVKKLKKQAKPFILHHKAWLRTIKRKNQHKKTVLKTSKRRSVFKQGRKTVKSSKVKPKGQYPTKEKEKGVEIRNAKNTERPRTISTRSVLTLKPLPKIDPKAKGKNRIEEDEESDTESEEITKAKKKFDQIAHDEETALSNEYEIIQARIEADRLLAKRVQEAEREQCTVEERAKFLYDTIATQRRTLLKQRTKAIETNLRTKNRMKESRLKEINEELVILQKEEVVKEDVSTSSTQKAHQEGIKLIYGNLKIMMESSIEVTEQVISRMINKLGDATWRQHTERLVHNKQLVVKTSSNPFMDTIIPKIEVVPFNSPCFMVNLASLGINSSLSMAVLAITILANVSEESVTSVVSRLILFGTIPTEIPIIPNMPTDLPTVSELPAVSPFLCSDDSESESAGESPKRHVSLRLHGDMISRWRDRVRSH
ncbi:putative ribonuclease H-like domain-containing protein [Tanacetum coccineum]